MSVYPAGVAQRHSVFVEPFQGTICRCDFTWGGAAPQLTPGYWVKRLRRSRKSFKHNNKKPDGL